MPLSEGCLNRGYPSSQRGGTVIATDVEDLEEHDKRVADVDGYRPDHCANCLRARPHGHGQRVRGLRAWRERLDYLVEIRRYRCPGCRALWTVIPVFMARCLWRAWGTVQGAVSGRSSAVPKRTRRRWRARLRSEGRKLVTVLTTAGDATLRTLVGAAGLDASRHEVVEALGGLTVLEALASLVHRLRPGVRVM